MEKKIKKHPDWLDRWEYGRPSELPDALSCLELKEYVESLESSGHGKRQLQLEHIKDELRYPWLDLRKSMTKYTESDLFSFIYGESDRTLYVGLKIGFTVMDIRDISADPRGRRRQLAMARTDSNGLRGVISQYEVTDGFWDDDRSTLADYVQV